MTDDLRPEYKRSVSVEIVREKYADRIKTDSKEVLVEPDRFDHAELTCPNPSVTQPMPAAFGDDLPVMAPHWKLSTGDYHRMIAAGILPEDARIELIKGELIDMGTVGYLHASTVNLTNESLTELVRGRAIVSTQNPLWLGPHSEPQPDFTLLRPRPDRYRTGLPRAEDVLLVIEIADASLRYDRDIKGPLYALAGLPEYWIVNLPNRTIEIHRDPDKTSGRYLTVNEVSDGTLSPLALPDLAVDITGWLN